MMGIYNFTVVSAAISIFVLISPAHAQLADNLMVSGSERPMADGVGTYGLKGAGTQGVSGKSEAGGLYSARIPTVTLSRSVPGVMVSDGAGHAKVFNNNLDALGALAGIIGSNIDQQIKAHDQEQAAERIPGNSFVAVQSPQLAPQPSVSSTFYGQPALLTQDGAPSDDSQALGRKMLQQGTEGVATSLASMGSQAFGSLAHTVVNGVADLAQGKGPTITHAADGTLQVLTNNNSGDEVQFQRDGTLTWVNGGNAPGIFSAYAAGAPSVTISNDPSTADSSSRTLYSGAVAQAPSASTYQNTQNAQPVSTNQGPTTSGYGAGTAAPAPEYAASAAGSSSSSIYSNALPASSSNIQVQSQAPMQDASPMAAGVSPASATVPAAAATSTEDAGVETCCGVARAMASAPPPAQAYGNMQAATYFQAQQTQSQAQDAQGPAAAAESFVTQALGQLQAQQGLPVTQMGVGTGGNAGAHSSGRRLLHPAAV